MRKAFSLIELLVVVAIITILAAIAIPIYTQYSVKAKVSQGYNVLFNFAQTVMTQYARTGVNPASINYNGITFLDSGYDTPAGIGNVAYMDYVYYAPTKTFRFDAGLSGLTGLPGYVQSAGAGNEGSYGYIRVIAYQDGAGNIKYGCGSYQSGINDTVDVPLSYQPANCNCYVQDVLLRIKSSC